MNQTNILKRAWKILWNYRALWIFGVILACTGGSSFFWGGGGRDSGSNVNTTGDFNRMFNFRLPEEITSEFQKLNRLFEDGIATDVGSTILWIIIAVSCIALLLFVLFTIGRYVSQTALIRMVDTYEDTGEKSSWRKGFRLGWSRAAFRLFLIDLVIILPIAAGFIVLMACAAAPVIFGFIGGLAAGIIGIIAAIGIIFLVIFLGFIISLALSLVLEIFYRVCVLKNLGVLDSIRQGWRVVRARIKDVVLMWLVLLGIRMGTSIAMFVVVVILLIIGGLLGGGIGVGLFFAVKASATLTAAWITALVVGGLLFFAILVIPLLFLQGLIASYLSTAWTLTYRELNPAEPPSSAQTVEPVKNIEP